MDIVRGGNGIVDRTGERMDAQYIETVSRTMGNGKAHGRRLARRRASNHHYHQITGKGSYEQERLEDEADLLAAQLRELLLVHRRDLEVLDEYLAACGHVEAGHAVHQGRFARTGRPHERGHCGEPHTPIRYDAVMGGPPVAVSDTMQLQCIRVDLPEPDGPIIAVSSPRWKSTLTWLSAVTWLSVSP